MLDLPKSLLFCWWLFWFNSPQKGKAAAVSPSVLALVAVLGHCPALKLGRKEWFNQPLPWSLSGEPRWAPSDQLQPVFTQASPWLFCQCGPAVSALWDCSGVSAQQSRMPDLGRILSQANNFLATDDIQWTHFCLAPRTLCLLGRKALMRVPSVHPKASRNYKSQV